MSGSDYEHQALCQMLDLLVPEGGCLAVIAEAFFDESNTHDKAGTMCVAGYLFMPRQCRSFDKRWAAMLKRHSIPYFRTADCSHANGVFDGKDDECDSAQRNAINAVKKYSVFGFASAINQAQYLNAIANFKQQDVLAPYSWCVWGCLMAMRSWADSTNFTGEIAYVFESGADHQGEANWLMNGIFSNDELRSAYRYYSHAFMDKERVRPLQAADLLAYHYTKNIKNLESGKPSRMDYAALVRDQDKCNNWSDVGMRRLIGGMPTFVAALGPRV